MSRECKDPCFSNPLCRGYGGLLGAYLWEKEGGASLEDAFLSKEDGKRDDVMSVGGAHSGQEDEQLGGSYAKFALKDFAGLLRLARSKRGVYDSFVNKYWQLLVQLGRQEDALEVLKCFREMCPQRINAHRYMLQFLSKIKSRGALSAELVALEVDCWRSLVRLDQSCAEVVLLAEYLLHEDSCDAKNVLVLLVEFLDYPHNAAEPRAWELLHTLQSKWPACLECSEWSQRVKWWKKIYATQLSVLSGANCSAKEQY